MLSFFASATLLATTFSSIVSAAPLASRGFPGRKSQIVAYYGQTGGQEVLETYCADENVDIIPIAFVDGFPNQNGNGAYPSANFGNQCGSASYPNTNMFARCDQMINSIQTCQGLGKKILISMGGGIPGYSLGSDADGTAFANAMWNTFGPKQANYTGPRPFGDLSVDGFDFDIESGGGTGYGAMAYQLRSLIDNSGRNMIMTAAPQCIVPDANLAAAIKAAKFDHLYIQFYNTPQCSARSGVTAPNSNGYDISFDSWVSWISSNVKPVQNQPKLFIGLPGSVNGVSTQHAADYLDAADAKTILERFYDSPMFGGVMLWDIANAYSNVDGNYIDTIAGILAECGSGSSTTTASTLPSTTPSSIPTSIPTTTPTTIASTTPSFSPPAITSPSTSSSSMTSPSTTSTSSSTRSCSTCSFPFPSPTTSSTSSTSSSSTSSSTTTSPFTWPGMGSITPSSSAIPSSTITSSGSASPSSSVQGGPGGWASWTNSASSADPTTKPGGQFWSSAPASGYSTANPSGDVWSSWATITSKPVDPTSSITSWTHWPAPSNVYVTTTTTVYTDVCPTGFTTVTATITATVTVTDTVYPTGKNAAWPTGAGGVPSGFYTTTAVCTAGCGDGPKTVTVTIPIPKLVTVTVEPTPATPAATSSSPSAAAWSSWTSSASVAAVTGGSWSSGSDPLPVADVSAKVPDSASTGAANAYATGSPVGGYSGSNGSPIQTYTGGAAVEQAPATAFSVAVCVVLAVVGLVF